MKKTDKPGYLLLAVQPSFRTARGGTTSKGIHRGLGACKKLKGSYLSDPQGRKLISSKETVLFPFFYTLALACSEGIQEQLYEVRAKV